MRCICSRIDPWSSGFAAASWSRSSMSDPASSTYARALRGAAPSSLRSTIARRFCSSATMGGAAASAEIAASAAASALGGVSFCGSTRSASIMVVDRDVTWDVPSPLGQLANRMNEDASGSVSIPPAATPSPLGAACALRIFAAYLGAQLVVAVVVGVLVAVRNLRAGGPASPGGIQLDPRLTLAAALVATLVAGLVALRMVRTTFARDGGDSARIAVGWKGASARDCARAALQGLGLLVAFVVVGSILPSRPHALGPLARAAMVGGGG